MDHAEAGAGQQTQNLFRALAIEQMIFHPDMSHRGQGICLREDLPLGSLAIELEQIDGPADALDSSFQSQLQNADSVCAGTSAGGI